MIDEKDEGHREAGNEAKKNSKNAEDKGDRHSSEKRTLICVEKLLIEHKSVRSLNKNAGGEQYTKVTIDTRKIVPIALANPLICCFLSSKTFLIFWPSSAARALIVFISKNLLSVVFL